MATIYFSLSTKSSDLKRQIMVRFTCSYVNQRAKTGIYIYPEYWDEKTASIVMPRLRVMSPQLQAIIAELREIEDKLKELRTFIEDAYFYNPDAPKNEQGWLKRVVSQAVYGIPDLDFKSPDYWGAWELFIETRNVSKKRRDITRVVQRILKRFETVKKIRDKSFELNFDAMTPLLLSEIDNFMRNEEEYAKRYPFVYEGIHEVRYQRGSNTVAGRLSVLRTFCRWAVNRDLTANNPFTKYSIKPASYGTPIYITKEERDKILATDFGTHTLNLVRDLFVFQCCIGCRVGDYFKMTKHNIIDGAIEYIAGKTSDDRPLTVRVPLNSVAQGILARHKHTKKNMLLPFISQQKYNTYIKECFRRAGITRIVTQQNPLTGLSEQVPICDIASSHMARRTFIGNLYNKVQDPSLIGVLSGHSEGSKAFARYRDIGEDLKRKTVELLE